MKRTFEVHRDRENFCMPMWLDQYPGYGFAVCVRGLARYFNIPARARTLYVTISKSPEKGAVRLDYYDLPWKLRVDGSRPIDVNSSLYDLVEDFGGTAFLWVEYDR